MANVCEYYPCHDNPCKGFNCEFCYCPLYEDVCEKFGGNPNWIFTGRTKIKDCTECMLPHTTEFKEIGDERIREVLRRKNGWFGY